MVLEQVGDNAAAHCRFVVYRRVLRHNTDR